MNTSYVQGFMQKCAEAGIDAEELIKNSQRMKFTVDALKRLSQGMPMQHIGNPGSVIPVEDVLSAIKSRLQFDPFERTFASYLGRGAGTKGMGDRVILPFTQGDAGSITPLDVVKATRKILSGSRAERKGQDMLSKLGL